MTKKDERKLRDRLQNLYSRLVEDMDSLRDLDAEAKLEAGAEDSDIAELEAERDLVHRQEWDVANKQRKIKLALERLDKGTSQICRGCRGDIPIERLFAKPYATLCVNCQRVREEMRQPHV